MTATAGFLDRATMLAKVNLRVPPFKGFEGLPEAEQPHVAAEELLCALINEIEGHERTQQMMIGPSEIGHPCPRWILRKLAWQRPPVDRLPWRATVGTAVHSWAELALNRDNERKRRFISELLGRPSTDPDRWLTERAVKVGQVGGRDIIGHVDVFDCELFGVWDWKTKTKSKMDILKRKGPPDIYEVQADCYGLGYELLGWPVRSVGNINLLREGEFRDSYVWARPYDRDNALRALNRLAGFQEMLDLFGLDAALEMHPERCDYEHCEWCKNEKPAPTTAAELFHLKG